MAVRSYNPKDLVVIAAGEIIEAFADGTFVSIERNEDSANLAVGSQGDATRTITNNRSGRVTLTLLQTSPSNATLNAQLKALELAGGGIFSVLVKDNSGLDICSALTAWIVKPPVMDYSNENSNREWIIETDVLEMNPMGAA